VAKVKGAEKEKDSPAKGEQLKAEEQGPTSVSGSPARPKVEDPIPGMEANLMDALLKVLVNLQLL
jgi:hypothetical protein